jgi:hypothetical protein
MNLEKVVGGDVPLEGRGSPSYIGLAQNSKQQQILHRDLGL